MKKETLFVRIVQKNGPTQFMRCGVMFDRTWKCLMDVDAATRKRLEAEQMLELTTEQPDDYNADAKVAAELRQEAESLRKDGSAGMSQDKDSPVVPVVKNQKSGK